MTYRIPIYPAKRVSAILAAVWIVVAVALVGFLSGCAPIAERTTSETQKVAGQLAMSRTADVTKQNVTPPTTVTVAGTNNTVSLNVPVAQTTSHETTADTASGTDSLSANSATKIPLGVKILLLAAGLGALVFLLKYLRASSPAIKAATDLADSAIASQIDKLQQRVALATDSATIAQHQSDIASLEKQRGKLRAA